MATYYTRRSSATRSSRGNAPSGWRRNHNTVRHRSKIKLGTIGHTLMLAVLVLFFALLNVAQSARVTDYDFRIASAKDEIAGLEAQRDALAVENAKMVADAAVESSEVASAMVEAVASGYVGE